MRSQATIQAELTDEYADALTELHGHWMDEVEHDHVEEIAESMRADGYDKNFPIIVTHQNEVVDGRHRAAAAKVAGVQVVRVIRVAAESFEALDNDFADLHCAADAAREAVGLERIGL